MKKLFAVVIAVMMVAALALSATAFTYPNGNPYTPELGGQAPAQLNTWKLFKNTTYVQYDEVGISTKTNPDPAVWGDVNTGFYMINDPWNGFKPENADQPALVDGIKGLVFYGWVITEVPVEGFKYKINGGELGSGVSNAIAIDPEADADAGIEVVRANWATNLTTIYGTPTTTYAYRFAVSVPATYSTQNIKIYAMYADDTQEFIWNCTANIPGNTEIAAYVDPTVYPEPQPEEPEPEILVGDVTGDGKINNKDATRLFKYLSGQDVEIVEANSDINADGKINNKDFSRLFKQLSGAAA